MNYETEDYDNFNEEDIVNKTVKKSNRRRRYYPSNKPQSLIRNAITGIEYPYTVGSIDQLRLYKMIDATGKCDKEGFIITSKYDLPNSNSNHLFYDSPEQCMSHLQLTINPAEIARWRERLQIVT
jgi:hypothetical protein